MKTCKSCNKNKSIEDFPKVKTPSYSPQRYSSKCKFCTNLYVHDLTYFQYQKIYEIQNGKCALCNLSLDEITPNIDHCHSTGQVRGVLCRGCNISLGTIEKSLDSIESQLQFLERQKNRLELTAEYLASPPFKKIFSPTKIPPKNV